MIIRGLRQRAVTAVAVLPLLAGLIMTTTVTASSASAATLGSSRYMLNHLVVRSEHLSGYDRSKFTLWTDADGDGCNTRYEVLISEAVIKPSVSAGCWLSGGRWFSRYDGTYTRDPSTFDIDHMIPLHEAWQSGAYRWTADTRKRFANDLNYAKSLIAVTASSNRSKSDQEPQNWLPPRASYRCSYVAQWVAIKYRWRLRINPVEKSFLHDELAACGWPHVLRPARAKVVFKSSSGSSTVNYSVTPGAFCSEHGYYGYTSAGTLMQCKTSATDSSYRWRAA